MVVIAYYYYAESAPTRGSAWFLLGVIATVLQGEQYAMRPSVEAVQKILLLMLPDISILVIFVIFRCDALMLRCK